MHAHAAQASLLLFTSQEPLAAVPLTRAPSTCSLGRLPVLESPWLGMHCPACLPTEKGLLICIIESALEVSRHTCSCHAPLRHRSFCCARDADTEQRCVHSLCSRHML